MLAMARTEQEALAEENFDAAWSRFDVAWERAQLRGLEFYRAGDTAGAARYWAEAHAIAERHFEKDDPRRATSLTNQALMAMRRGERHAALNLLEAALAVWDRAWSWILYMRPQAEDGCRTVLYDREARAGFEALAARGRAATEHLLKHGDPIAEDGLLLWRRERPQNGSDARKLLAAVLLVVSRPPVAEGTDAAD